MPAEIHGAMAVNALVASLEVLYGIFLISGAWTVVMQGDWNLATYFDGMSRNRLYVGHLVRRGAPPCIGLRFTRTALEFLYAGPDGTTRVGIRARYRFGAPMARMTLGGDGYWRLHSETFSPPHVPDNIVYTMLQDRDDNHIPADFFIYDVDPAIAKPPPQHFAFAGSLGFTEVRSDVIICVDDGVGNFKLWGSNSHMLQGVSWPIAGPVSASDSARSLSSLATPSFTCMVPTTTLSHRTASTWTFPPAA
ncbi:hypothetical protein DFJ74DRAFT_688956 [Hyaloraphidium curvatum]|nr:hypothetical protein DFJ74DRAFT_688956 [Hyaloraphidium curvatum]